MQYYERNKLILPVLYQLDMVALAAPASEVSVERVFLTLRFILNDNSTNLKGDLTNKILVIRCNSQHIKISNSS